MNCNMSEVDAALFALLILLFLIHSITKRRKIDTIVVGDVWVRKNESPWPNPDALRVKILDVKDGWVRYSFLGTTMFQDERLVDHYFVYIYEKENTK